jgi:hypothetical protein
VPAAAGFPLAPLKHSAGTLPAGFVPNTLFLSNTLDRAGFVAGDAVPRRWGGPLLVYVTDGNIMYLTDASRFLISFNIMHLWWGGGTDA